MFFGLNKVSFKLSVAGGTLLVLFGLFTLVTRFTVPGLLAGLPDIAAFSNFTALCFVISGSALLIPSLTSRETAYRWQRRLGFILCLIGVAAAAQHYTGNTIISGYPLPALNTSIAFFLGGVFFVLWHRVDTHLMASALFMITLFIGTIALVGIVGLAIGFDPLFGWSSLVHMTGYTIAGLLVLSITLANKVWARVRNKRLKQMEGILYLAGVTIVFAALFAGMLIYTIAGANIYNDARQQLHLIAHERAEQLHSSLLLTELASGTIEKQIKQAARQDKLEPFIQTMNKLIRLTVTDIKTGEARHYGADPVRKTNSNLLPAPGFQLVTGESGNYFVEHIFSDTSHRYNVFYPLRLSPVMDRNPTEQPRYKVYLCAENTTSEKRCQLPPAEEKQAHTHHFQEQLFRPGDESPHADIGVYRDYSTSTQLLEAIAIPELHMTLFVARNIGSIYGALYHDMLNTLPITLLLLITTIALLSWRIAPLITTLRNNELQFRLLTENANDMISLHDMNGNYLYASPACRRLLGYSEDELIGHSAYEFFHPDDMPTVRTSHDTVMVSDDIPRVTYRIRCKDGEFRWFETASSRLSPGAMNKTEIIAVTRDITEKHNTEERLRESELRYRTLIEEASDAILLHDETRHFTEVNQAACDMLGYTREELVGMHPESLLLPEDYEDARQNLEKMQHRSITSRRQLLRKDGRFVTVEIHAKKIQENCILSIVRDVSEQVRIEHELRESREQWRSLIETAPDIVMTVDEEARLLFINRVPEGLNREQVIGQSVLDFVIPEHRTIVMQAIERVFAGEPHVDYELEANGNNGQVVWWSSRCGPVYHHNHIDSVIIITRDISERHKMEQALQQSEQMNRSVVSVLAEGIVVQDSNGVIISSNKAANDILGRQEEETDGKVSTDSDWAVIREDGTRFPGDEHPAMVALATGRSQRGVVMGVMRPEGERVWISVNADPILDESGDHVISVVSSFTDITEKRQAELELRESQAQLKALTSHLQEVREDEKEMIAREVHDELGSTMTAMKLGMSWIDQHIGESDPVLQEKVETISRQLEKAVVTVRRLVTQLRPTLLDDLGLWAAIEWQLREFSKYTHIEVRDNLHCQQVEMVNRNKALAIYRVIQEALTNIAKHAQATTIHLDCWDRDDVLHITLEDNGIGLTEKTVISPTSHGLRGMSERISTVGGKLEILGTAGEGTVIAIEVPHDEKGE